MIDDWWMINLLKKWCIGNQNYEKMILPRGTSASKASAAMDPADAPDT